MPQLDRALIKDRAQRLRALGAERVSEFLRAQIGRKRTVLMERDQVGRTEHFAEIEVHGRKSRDLELLDVQVTAMGQTRLIGEVAA